MKSTWRIARMAGIDLHIHWSFSLVIFLVIGQGVSSGRELPGILFILAALLLVFGCITLHELGHAWVALRLNVIVRGVTLLPIGGVAQMQTLPQRPSHELLIALAGPAVNLGLALGLALLLLVFDMGLFFGFLASPRTMIDAIFLQAPFQQNPLLGLVIFLIFANAVLFLFNLIPTLPMDGGRVLRALLATSMPSMRATQLTLGIGQLMVIALVFSAFRLRSMGLILIAIFVFIVGLPMLAAGRNKNGIAHYRSRVK